VDSQGLWIVNVYRKFLQTFWKLSKSISFIKTVSFDW
jgi:hypothetical protein